MGRVKQDTLDKLNAFLDSLPEESRNKCALCRETLTHVVKTAEVQTGAGTATVTRILSEKVNESAADGEKVSACALQDRVRRHEGVKMAKRQNNPEKVATKVDRQEKHHNENPQPKPRRKLSQQVVWERAANKLEAVADYMKAHCETPAPIDRNLKLKVRRHIGMINVFEEFLDEDIQWR